MDGGEVARGVIRAGAILLRKCVVHRRSGDQNRQLQTRCVVLYGLQTLLLVRLVRRAERNLIGSGPDGRMCALGTRQDEHT
jgi:hypothetical protein